MDPDLASLDLPGIPVAAFRLLQTGVEVAAHPFHAPCLATAGKHGPAQRTVVLRHVDADQRLVVCHTDRRSAKAREIREDSRVGWHFYDRKAKLQIRLHGKGVLHTDDPIADACWERSAARSRSCYNTPVGPGQTVREPPLAPRSIASEAEAAEARSHFAAIACHVRFMDWLYLSGTGHRRALFEFNGSRVSARWVTP